MFSINLCITSLPLFGYLAVQHSDLADPTAAWSPRGHSLQLPYSLLCRNAQTQILQTTRRFELIPGHSPVSGSSPPHHPLHTTFCFNFPPLEIRRQTRIILLLDSILILWCFVGWKGFWELKGWSVFLDFKYVHKLSSVVHKKCYKSYLRVRSFEHLRCPLKQI